MAKCYPTVLQKVKTVTGSFDQGIFVGPSCIQPSLNADHSGRRKT